MIAFIIGLLIGGLAGGLAFRNNAAKANKAIDSAESEVDSIKAKGKAALDGLKGK